MMKKTIILLLIALPLLLAFGGCSKEIIEENAQAEPSCRLSIITRADDAQAVPTGRIYIFNTNNKCVATLPISEGASATPAQLPAGTYSVYAVGGLDVERFSLPSQSDASPTSELELLSGKVMDDLLLKHTEQMTLSDGDDRTLTLQLERQVLRVDQVTIKQVPTNVTNVEVLLEPLYKKIRLNGTLPDNTESIAISLAKGDNNTWQATPLLYHFPSKGCPVITVKFTTSTGTKSYSYTAPEPLPANHKVKIEGTYTQSGGVTLQGMLTSTEWEEDKLISFVFDETDSSTSGGNDDTPGTITQGSTYKGCYVVSVNGNNATLASPTEMQNITYGAANVAEAIDMLDAALATWPSVNGIEGTWRLPTTTEAQIYLADVNCGEITSTRYYYCMDDETLKYIRVRDNQPGTIYPNDFVNQGWCRPVIEITLP